MNRNWVLRSLTLCLLSMLLVAGCADQAAPPAADDSANTTEAGSTESTTEETETVELSAEDKALVEAQVFCPLGGPLGSMGTPVKVMVEGKPIFLCCDGCREGVLADPEAAFAAIEKKKQEAAEKAASESNETSSEDDSEASSEEASS